MNKNTLYYTENPYLWERMNDSEEETVNADSLLESFYVSFYKKQIKHDFNWKQIKREALDNPIYGLDCDQYGSCYLGSVFSIMPSGKYWTFYADSNVDREEAIKDSAYNEALNFIAEKYGLWIESGEGDPCDLYACCAIESEEIED